MLRRRKTRVPNQGLSVGNWTSLPLSRVDKTFWLAFNDYLSPLLRPDFPLASEEFRSLRQTDHEMQAMPLVSDAALKAANEMRGYYDEVTLWNPLSLSVRLGIAMNVVIEQLLLAWEHHLVSMCFVIICQSCGCDMRRESNVCNIAFRSTYLKANAVRCPMCTMRTEVTSLAQVGVFFEEPNPPELLQQKYHRLFLSDEAQRRRLETYFCPPGAGFAFHLHLPQGRYLLVLSGAGMIAELRVATGAEYLDSMHPFDPLTVLVRNLSKTSPDDVGKEAVDERPVMHADHGKLLFRVFNDTAYGGYLDVFVAFDERLEFLSPKSPVVATVPLVLHHISRGLRSQLVQYFIPAPPGARTEGVYVVQSFALDEEEIGDPISNANNAILAIVREVHRYSLEDHRGLLLSAACGGTVFESLFLSFTAALASSLCFLQRVLSRIGEDVAASITCSITGGSMYMASFEGQYDDDENVLSSYPDVHIVGPALHAATHPPVVAGNEDASTVQSEAPFARVELRSVSESHTGICLCSSDGDEMLPQLLSFLEDHVIGVKVVREPQALVVLVPLATLNGAVLLPDLLDPKMYTKEITGPFG